MITFSENKMNTPLVSVIIPNYCHAKYLDQRIQSVLNQTYQNFEVIILDDCSPDDGASRAVIEKYRDNPHVSHIVYNETNSGSPFRQWHKGFQHAKGDVIWIAESDDYADRRFLETLMPCLLSHDNVSVAFCRSVLFNDEEGIIGQSGPASIKEGIIDGRKFIHDYMNTGTGIVNASSAIFRKSALDNCGNLYSSFRGAGDRMIWIELAEQGDVYFKETPYNYFRRHKNTTTHRCNETGINQIEDKRIFDYICEKGYISKSEIPVYRDLYVRIHIFEMITDKKLKKELFKIWEYSIWKQLLLRMEYFIQKHKKHE